MEKNKKGNLSVLLGAAFLMATSAIGPGFMTQTATFTNGLKADFAFVILVSIVMSYITQLNVWRVIAVSRLRGQDIANKVLPGLGYFIAFLVALGGLAFNIGNVGGAGLGINVIFGLDPKVGAAIGGILGVIIFTSKSAGKAMDKLTQILGAAMIILIAYVCATTAPPVSEAAKRMVAPSDMGATVPAILTLLGGTVGGYIVFSGGHRLIDAGVTGEENLSEVNKSATLGIVVALVVRILLFLAVLGVINSGGVLDEKNVAASAFRIASGEIGYKIFGIVFTAAALTSVVGAAFTSVSFLKTLFKPIGERANLVTILFIVFSTIIFIFIGQPQKLLVLVGALNGLILPITLAVMLIASKKKSIVGEYVHSNILFYLGWVVTVVSAYIGVTTFVSKMSTFF
ncbi:NRAMP family divalent metal transporter [Peptoniphilus sp. oral taxon 386]|uniref:NRAMP family divalent metal transporter n=1 Tax=Peptoniphilus sp. oral taxon 386 TaxID=652713 RepID=UPI0001DA99D6|nr:NRAMP family divalent metal transporter [Peptoniphilus sp. oral taxon 386]EFI41776.1 transporter, branched chain amino acid:cation symporter (LIVCS) family protein [Peptoniphilus sp. oral taxon 386 str. F0131]